jgi:hypothetical protein
MKPAVALLFFILSGILLATTTIYSLTDYCKVARPLSGDHSEQQQLNDLDPQQEPHHAHRKIRYIITSTAYDNNDPDQSVLLWWRNFICQIRITDIIVAFFTYCLVIVGIFQALLTTHTLMRLERAYILAAWTDIELSDNGKITIKFRFRNVGRSSGVVKEFVVKFVQSGPLPKRPDYSGAHRIEFDWGVEANSLKPDVVIEDSPYVGEQYMFGYVRYEDIFGKSRISRFGNRLFPDRQGERRAERAGGDPYNLYT